MQSNTIHKRAISLFIIVTILASVGVSLGLDTPKNVASGMGSFLPIQASPGNIQQSSNSPSQGNDLFLPLVFRQYPWSSPFGVESRSTLTPITILFKRATDLRVSYVRLNNRISWRNLQPNEGDPIQWDQLVNFEKELRSLNSAVIKPIVIVDDYPRWATRNNVRLDGQPTSCGPLDPSKYSAFAEFMRALVNRYKTPEFNVHIWEMGNEPDVDPNLVEPDNEFGCWGDVNDTAYYGGKQYGNMLKVVSPVIKSEDPNAQVWIGGLLLDSPNTTISVLGKPENFLKGILAAGAAPDIDMVPYHWYPPYENQKVDHDNALPGVWLAWGGGTVGKARYLRQVMAQYGVDKPLFLDENGLMCAPEIGGVPTDWCEPPGDSFYQMQADYVVRSFVRGINENISGFIWYTLDGPGWRYTGLLDAQGNPLPAYTAYLQLTTRLLGTTFVGPVDYGSGIEAYAFKRDTVRVQVLWAKTDGTLTISVPQDKFLAAYDRDGNPLTPSIAGTLDVGFDPIYLELLP